MLEKELSGTGSAWSQLDFCTSNPDPKLCSLGACSVQHGAVLGKSCWKSMRVEGEDSPQAGGVGQKCCSCISPLGH